MKGLALNSMLRSSVDLQAWEGQNLWLPELPLEFELKVPSFSKYINKAKTESKFCVAAL